jgi:hypothetical protein
VGFDEDGSESDMDESDEEAMTIDEEVAASAAMVAEVEAVGAPAPAVPEVAASAAMAADVDAIRAPAPAVPEVASAAMAAVGKLAPAAARGASEGSMARKGKRPASAASKERPEPGSSSSKKVRAMSIPDETTEQEEALESKLFRYPSY